ncbi:MAG: hypothetical protein FJ196_03590 [Gammaproteobacteria bacterium]|nr:hypothetical protein [Gammaproteobacteria bacterium]
MPLLLRHILRPFHPTTLLLVAVFTLLFAIAGAAGLLGLPLFLIAFSWTLKYAYVLLEYVANGIDEPPVLSVEMVNPVEQRPLFQLAIILSVVALVLWIEGPLAIAIVVIATMLLPTSTAILWASGRILAAANPIEMFRTMRTMGWTYAALLGVVAVAVAVAAAAFVYAADRRIVLC